VNDRIKLFDSQSILETHDYDERTRYGWTIFQKILCLISKFWSSFRDEKAEAIRREVLELKAQRNDELPSISATNSTGMMTKVEKVAPKQKLSDPGPPKASLGVPGATLRYYCLIFGAVFKNTE